MRIGPGIEVVANLAQKSSVSVEFEELCRCGTVRRTSRIPAREHEDMAFRIHRDTGNFAKIEIAWEVQEIGHGAVLNLGYPRGLRRKRTGGMRNSQEKKNPREFHFPSSLDDLLQDSFRNVPRNPNRPVTI